MYIIQLLYKLIEAFLAMCGQMVKTSSMYLYLIVGFLAGTSSKWVSSQPVNMSTYEGFILVTIAVPCNCKLREKIFL